MARRPSRRQQPVTATTHPTQPHFSSTTSRPGPQGAQRLRTGSGALAPFSGSTISMAALFAASSLYPVLLVGAESRVSGRRVKGRLCRSPWRRRSVATRRPAVRPAPRGGVPLAQRRGTAHHHRQPRRALGRRAPTCLRQLHRRRRGDSQPAHRSRSSLIFQSALESRRSHLRVSAEPHSYRRQDNGIVPPCELARPSGVPSHRLVAPSPSLGIFAAPC